MQNFEIYKTPLDGLRLGQIISKADARGYFERVYCLAEYQSLLNRDARISQINRSMSKIQGTVRGLHFQWPPYAETKIISCPKGRLYDVALDLRVGSETYLQHYAVELSSENKLFLVIPEGFAHGFQTLDRDTEILYLVTEQYSLEHDDGINPLDPQVAIEWPIEVTLRSEKDTNRPFISQRGFNGIKLTPK
jgi:dTDP-4-dehydrorhamnose 3,5-epimerase